MEQTTPPPPHTDEAQDIAKNKDIAAFSYLWIMSVVVYILRRDSPFVRFHSRQAMVLFVLSVLVWFIPFIGRLLALIVFGGMVVGFIAAAQGHKKDVPVVGPLSRGEISLRQAWRQIVEAVALAVKAIKDLLHKDHPANAKGRPHASKNDAIIVTPIVTPAAEASTSAAPADTGSSFDSGSSSSSADSSSASSS